MTGKEDPTKDEPLTAEEEEHQYRLLALELSIGQALRRAAGLPDEEDPFIERSDEAHLPDLDYVTTEVIIQSSSSEMSNPRAVEAKLEAVRRDIKRLRNSIASLDEFTEWLIHTSDGAAGVEEFETMIRSGDAEHFVSAIFSSAVVPRDQWAVPAALAVMERFEAAIVKTIELNIGLSERLPTTGRIPNFAARDVAYVVAQYLRDVTGKPPTLWKGDKPSGPFARALREIFKILDIKAGVQRPGEYAISKLSEIPEF